MAIIYQRMIFTIEEDYGIGIKLQYSITCEIGF